MSVGIFNSTKKRTKKFDFIGATQDKCPVEILQNFVAFSEYMNFDIYGTSSRIVFVRFLEELMTPKRHFGIN